MYIHTCVCNIFISNNICVYIMYYDVLCIFVQITLILHIFFTRHALYTLPQTNSSPMTISSFLVNTIKMLDFPANYVKLPGSVHVFCCEDSENLLLKPRQVETAEADERHSLQRAKHSGRALLGIHLQRPTRRVVTPHGGGFVREMGPLISQKI